MMKAMIFAAGLGTRLRPLTNNKPKALVEVNGTPMLGLLISKLKQSGFDTIVINVHHFAPLIKEYLHANNCFGIEIHISDESNLLLDTGGGLMFARKFFDDGESFLLHNVDIYSDINLNEIINFHRTSGNLVTLAVKQRPSSNYLIFDDRGLLCGWKSIKTGEEKISRKITVRNELAFSGIHVIDPKLFKLIGKQGAFGIIGEYLRLAATEALGAFVHNDNQIIDLGKPEAIAEAEAILANKI